MIHYLLLAHKNFDQVELLINKLKTNNSKVYIHVDWKVKNFPKFKNAIIIGNRVKCHWWWFSVLKSIINWIYDIYINMSPWDHVVVISGQCRPIKRIDIIEESISKLKGKSVLSFKEWNIRSIRRIDSYFFNDIDFHIPQKFDKIMYKLVVKFWYNLYWTKTPFINAVIQKIVTFVLPRRKFLKNNYKIFEWWGWVVLSYSHIKRIIEFLDSEKWKNFFNSFKMTLIPDEFFFQTLLCNSPLKNEIINKSVWFTKREEKASSPIILTIDNYNELKESDKLFARKFDIKEDWQNVKKIEKENN